MSFAVLTQVSDEVRRLAIAGSVVAGNDFRLKKLIPPLEQSAAKAPVFGKVASAVSKLVESNEQDSAAALLELSSLVNAILYTQGETGLDGELAEIKSVNVDIPSSQVSARVMKPLLEALTTTGSGRIDIIRDAFERGAFHDLRLIMPALDALDDRFSEISEFIAERVLPLYGRAILPELQAKFNCQGRGGDVRRLELMVRLDPDGSRPLVKESLETGSKEIKVAAIAFLNNEAEDLPFLLEQVRAKSKEVRAAAYRSLGRIGAKDAAAVLTAALKGKDLEIVVRPLQSINSTELVTAAIEETQAQAAKLLARNETDNKKLGSEVQRLQHLLDCFRGRQDWLSVELICNLFRQRAALVEVKGEPSGKDVVQKLVQLLLEGGAVAQKELVDAHETLSEEYLPHAFMAAVRSLSPQEVLTKFSPYVTAHFDQKKKKSDPVALKQQAITELLSRAWRWRYLPYTDKDADDDATLVNKLDPRWLDLAVQQKNLEIVQSLARPGHAAANALLEEAFDATLKKSKDIHECAFLLRTMARVDHPQLTNSIVATIKAHAKATNAWGLHQVLQIIPALPVDAIPRLEELMSKLPEKLAIQMLDQVTELKLKQLKV